MTLFEEVVSLKIPYSNHCSDLYIPRTEQTIGLLKKHGIGTAQTFKNQVEGGLWLDVAFQFDPAWECKK
jgi:hypothetical protein